MRPSFYSIVVEGELGPRYGAAFRGMRLETGDGVTTIVGEVADQAELQGLLDEVAALGLSLVSVSSVEPGAGDQRRSGPAAGLTDVDTAK